MSYSDLLTPAVKLRAFRACAREHTYRCDGITPLPISAFVVEAFTVFDDLNKWGDMGTIEITYAKEGCRALYGFTPDFQFTCYAD